ncbi:Predicted dithiol-disulfide isomerase, DsbA family [Geopseudomonas sagittaria]|uniref:Predicted dithiol-disulfide isomerase, DsbA family n=1 Tax=Geopseudomonas sagittaria TaxID=1135990 RepID=A0A1I5YKK2_9GAMM|nr:DsbA family oxidoreductase [Pseudomonas sagittaria]SFQ44728.1 Predicted dithiol-disulfide isomerase, DsbA family [Pseudomonas sagittaria]
MSQPLHIEVFFDFICPWCLIGKRQLERALARLRATRPDVEVELEWHGVQLLPDLPAAGVPFAEFYLRRLGSEQAVRLRQAQVREAAAAAAGLSIDFARIERMPNTGDAHRLLERAAAIGSPAQVEALLERLFAAYFHNGEDLGDPATLLLIAEDCGFAPAELVDNLRGDGWPFFGDAAGMAGNGVPYFVFDRHLAVSGSQSAEVLLGAMRAALARRDAEGQLA